MNNPGTVLIPICWWIYILFWFVTGFFTKKSVTKRRWGLFWRLALIVLVIIFIRLMGGRKGLHFMITPLFHSNLVFQIIGIVILVLGLSGAIWARIYLGRNWSGYVTYKVDHELVTGGPYSFIRHPIYSFIFLMIIGTFIYDGSFLVLEGLILSGLIFFWRIKKEEVIMISIFGQEYSDYMKRTRCLIPWVY